MLLSKYLIVCFIAVFIDRQPNGPTLPPVVCRRAHGLFTLFVFVCVYWYQTHIVLWFFPSYCVPYVVSFSGLSLFFPSYCVPYVSVNNIYWIFVRKLLCCQFLWIVFVFFLRIVYPMLPVSLECLCFIALTLLSNVHLKMLKLSSLHVYILRI